jgi:acyl-CoA synthetase (AMP-forming)/AMP-acid ligase II
MGHGAPEIAAFLAVLKAGRIAVVLNPGDPPSRLVQLLQDSEAGSIVTDEDHLKLAGEVAGGTCDLMTFAAKDRAGFVDNPGIQISPDDIAQGPEDLSERVKIPDITERSW